MSGLYDARHRWVQVELGMKGELFANIIVQLSEHKLMLDKKKGLVQEKLKWQIYIFSTLVGLKISEQSFLYN